MRVQLRSLVPTIVAILGIFALHNPALAGRGDIDAEVRGSLGASLSDLSVGDGGGIWFLLLNGAFALAFIIAARMLARREAPRRNAQRNAWPAANPGRVC